MTETVYIGLGSNLGDRERFLSQAVAQLREVAGLEVVAISSIYAGPAQDMAAGTPGFLNQVIKAEYAFTPTELLDGLEKIEVELGREGKGERLARTIDIDILLFGERQVETSRLEIPHPRLTGRSFVLVPLLEIEPDLNHPTTGKPLSGYVKTAGQTQIEIYRDHVARQV